MAILKIRCDITETAGCQPSNRSGNRLALLARYLPCCFSLLAIPAMTFQANSVYAQQASKTVLASLQDAFVAVADELEPAVVTVSSSKAGRAADGDAGRSPFRSQQRSVGTGTGLIVRRDGWILTNDHVVSGADRVTVKFHDGREIPGRVLRDPRSDLAMVKVDVKENLPVARLGDSDKVKIGQWAIAIGSPYKFEGSFSVGVISSLMRKQEIEDASASSRGRLYPNMIQTDAAINPGNSGGPLCNVNGEVIGINTAIQSPQSQGGSIGIGFAIPINTAKYVIAQLLEKGKVSYGFLGVSPTSVTPNQALALKVDAGALISRDPPEGSPAAKAGLKAGDVIISIAGKSIKSEIDLRTIVSQTPPLTSIEIKFVRDGATRGVSAVLDKAADEPISAPAKSAEKPQLGLEVDKLTDKIADDIRVPRSTQGVLLKAIDPNTAAADDDDLIEGSVILRINDKETPTVEAFNEAIAGLKSGDQVRVSYLRTERGEGPVRRFTVLTVD